MVKNEKYIPDSLAIGDDECSNAVLYANGTNGFGVYMEKVVMQKPQQLTLP